MENTPPEQKPVKKEFDSNRFWMMFLELGTEFAFIIALPLIGAIYLGKWLNVRYDSNAYVAVLALIAIIFSWYIIFKRVMAIKKLLEK